MQTIEVEREKLRINLEKQFRQQTAICVKPNWPNSSQMTSRIESQLCNSFGHDVAAYHGIANAMVKYLAENPVDRVGLLNGDLKPAQFLKSMENKWQQDTYVPEGEITEKEPKACPCNEWNCHKRCCR